jgi:oligopeptide transport system ATP-binding protein
MLAGNPPSLATEIVGDAFAPRNEYALEIDFEYAPPYFKITDTHYAKT